MLWSEDSLLPHFSANIPIKEVLPAQLWDADMLPTAKIRLKTSQFDTACSEVRALIIIITYLSGWRTLISVYLQAHLCCVCTGNTGHKYSAWAQL